MNKLKLMIASLVLAVSGALYAKPVPFFEAETGLLMSNGGQAPIYGVRGGFANDHQELSLGYWSAVGLPVSDLASGGLSLHTFDVEGYGLADITKRTTLKWGGGLGWTIPNLNDGASETADNDLSLILGGGAVHKINPNMDFVFTLKGFFFRTDTHLTTYGSHFETLYNNGVPVGGVEVLDEHHSNNVVSLNSAKLSLALHWR